MWQSIKYTINQARLSKHLLWLGFILVFSGCKDNNKSDEQNAFDKNIALWKQQNISDYQVSSQIFYFWSNTEKTVNIVKQSQVSNAFVAGSGEYLSNEALNHQKSIYGYFVMIQVAINNEEASLVVSYHPTLGYPTSITIVDYNLVHGENTYELTNFKQGIENIEKPELNLQLVLRDQFEQASDVFLQDETINFYLTISNTGNQTTSMNFRQQYDFTISSGTSFDGSVIWRWSDDESFISATTELVIEPGETLEFSIDWDQKLPDGQTIAIDDYSINGFIFMTNINAQENLSIQ